MAKTKHILIMFSGGKESIYNLHKAAQEKNVAIGLVHYDYGQFSIYNEREALEYYAKKFNTKIYKFRIPMFVNKAIDSAKNVDNIVHMRNIIFTTHAANIAMNEGYSEICIGVNKFVNRTVDDRSQHFLRDYNPIIRKYTKNAVSLISYTQFFGPMEVHQQIISEEMDMSKLWMCESDGANSFGRHCGKCRKCKTFLDVMDKSRATKLFVERLF